MDVVNAEWALTYDKTKLELDTVRSKDYMPNIPNEVTNVKRQTEKYCQTLRIFQTSPISRAARYLSERTLRL